MKLLNSGTDWTIYSFRVKCVDAFSERVNILVGTIGHIKFFTTKSLFKSADLCRVVLDLVYIQYTLDLRIVSLLVFLRSA